MSARSRLLAPTPPSHQAAPSSSILSGTRGISPSSSPSRRRDRPLVTKRAAASPAHAHEQGACQTRPLAHQHRCPHRLQPLKAT
eukprot:4942914-Pleurochrysis_carterae.AAC.1